MQNAISVAQIIGNVLYAIISGAHYHLMDGNEITSLILSYFELHFAPQKNVEHNWSFRNNIVDSTTIWYNVDINFISIWLNTMEFSFDFNWMLIKFNSIWMKFIPFGFFERTMHFNNKLDVSREFQRNKSKWKVNGGYLQYIWILEHLTDRATWFDTELISFWMKKNKQKRNKWIEKKTRKKSIFSEEAENLHIRLLCANWFLRQLQIVFQVRKEVPHSQKEFHLPNLVTIC